MTLTKLSVVWLILKMLSSPPFKTQFYNACLPSLITENLIHGVCRKDVHATTELLLFPEQVDRGFKPFSKVSSLLPLVQGHEREEGGGRHVQSGKVWESTSLSRARP